MTEWLFYVFSEMGLIIGLNENLSKVMPIRYLPELTIKSVYLPFLPNLISHYKLVNIFIIIFQKHHGSMTLP